MKSSTYWITVASRDHVLRGVAGGFMQANHGKPAPLRRTKPNDWVIFYSPLMSLGGKERCQCFTAIGQVKDEPIYQFAMTEDFIPYRRNIEFYPCQEITILPLIERLEFIPNKQSWGFPFRFGFFEINEHDFRLISTQMLPE